MIKIEDYILLPLTERQAHLKLDEPCVERGIDPKFGSSTLRGLLAHIFDTTMPKGMKGPYVCHACNNSKCCNIKHLYWGTPRENVMDGIRCGKMRSTWENAILKYGREKMKELNSGFARRPRRKKIGAVAKC